MRHLPTILAPAVALLFLATSASAELASGQPIPLGDGNSRGPLSPDSIQVKPYGWGRVFGGAQPDLFVEGSNTGFRLYRWTATDEGTGAPVFEYAHSVQDPLGNSSDPREGTVFQHEATTYGVFLDGDEVIVSTYAAGFRRFIERNRFSIGGRLPRNPANVCVVPNEDGTWEFLFTVGDGESMAPRDFENWDERFRWHDGAGIARGDLEPYFTVHGMTLQELEAPGAIQNVRRVSTRENDILVRPYSLSLGDFGAGRDVIAATRFGVIHYYRNIEEDNGFTTDERRFLASPSGSMRPPGPTSASAVTYPNPVSGLDDVLVGGEGALYWFRTTGDFAPTGAPIVDTQGLHVLEEDASIYAGSLGVANIVDWNGDNANDLIVGNSEGYFMFFENDGTTAAPSFRDGVRLQVAGEDIRIQPGYWQAAQGPPEARWGYVCPTVVDWNEDGLPDIITGGSQVEYLVYLNVGTATAPQLAPPYPLMCEGLPLTGTWRTKPGIARLGDRMGVVILDEKDELRHYWKLDDRTVEDGGRVRMSNGAYVLASRPDRASGAFGRLKINLADWDEDGRTDLVLGTVLGHSIPDPVTGIPFHGMPDGSYMRATILFMKNSGTEQDPVYDYPVFIGHDGEGIDLGGHSCGPAVGQLGPSGKALVSAREIGRVYYFDPSRLSLLPNPLAPEWAGQ